MVLVEPSDFTQPLNCLLCFQLLPIPQYSINVYLFICAVSLSDMSERGSLQTPIIGSSSQCIYSIFSSAFSTFHLHRLRNCFSVSIMTVKFSEPSLLFICHRYLIGLILKISVLFIFSSNSLLAHILRLCRESLFAVQCLNYCLLHYTHPEQLIPVVWHCLQFLGFRATRP